MGIGTINNCIAYVYKLNRFYFMEVIYNVKGHTCDTAKLGDIFFWSTVVSWKHVDSFAYVGLQRSKEALEEQFIVVKI